MGDEAHEQDQASDEHEQEHHRHEHHRHEHHLLGDLAEHLREDLVDDGMGVAGATPLTSRDVEELEVEERDRRD